MSASATVGIDNACSGAIAILRGSHVRVLPVQVYKEGKATVLDDLWLAELLAAEAAQGSLHVVVEQAQKFSPGKFALISTWACWASIRTVLRLGKHPFTAVNPMQWQREMLAGVVRKDPGDTKTASIAVAKRLFPGVSLRRSPRCTTDCDGMSDALLLAEFGRRKNL